MRDPDLPLPVSLQADDLEAWIDCQSESDYLILDVRQPDEYRHGHIPGAKLLPLLELESKLFDLPFDRDLVFYCSNGGRSLAAATLVIDAEVTKRKVYNLTGGILRWYGQTLAGFPRIDVFDESGDFDSLLYTAMNLEKGAFRFYEAMANRYAAEPCAATLETLGRAETAHAASVYELWASRADSPPSFERLYDDLPGDILEGGESLTDVVAEISSPLSEGACIDLIELSLLIEYRAFELYRTVAEHTPDEEARDTMLSLAQAEKSHMRVLTRAIATCGG